MSTREDREWDAYQDAHEVIRPDVYGMCTGCGSVEVRLRNPTGTRDLSGIGESATYPTGYGCEVCA